MVNSNYKILCPIYILRPAAISTCAVSYLVLCDQTCLNGKVDFNENFKMCLGPRFLFQQLHEHPKTFPQKVNIPK